MVQNKLRWDANNALGLKTKERPAGLVRVPLF